MPSSDHRSRRPERSHAGPQGPGVLGFETRLWEVADELRTNSSLQPSSYAAPVLALIFLVHANREVGAGRLRIPDEARLARLRERGEAGELGPALDGAMAALEAANPRLAGVLPRTFASFEPSTLARLFETFTAISADSGDTFGRIYEYFLGNFAPQILQKGGEFFTPESVVKLIVEIVEPFHGRILDPACGSGGMFVQSARFVAEHEHNPSEQIAIHGIEKNRETLGLAQMNLAVHGLVGDLRAANTFYEDPHDCVGKFDFVLANPPFNQKAVSRAELVDVERRFPFGVPKRGNANFLWIQLIYSALCETGRAGFVMANSTVEPRGAEREIASKLLETGAVEAIVSLASNLFYTVTIPVTLWFLNRSKPRAAQRDSVLFIDATELFRQVDRAHRELEPEQIEFIANVVRLYRGDEIASNRGSAPLLAKHFGKRRYRDVAGLCRVVSVAEVAQTGSLNPGRYVGVASDEAASSGSFADEFARLADELERRTAEAHELEQVIRANTEALLRELE